MPSTARCTVSARSVARPPTRGSSARRLKNSRTSWACISPITRRPGAMRRALANSAGMSVLAVHAEAHAERALLERRQVRSALDGDEAVVHGDELEERVEQRRLPRRAVAEDDQRAPVADELRQRGALAAGQGAALEQAAEGRGDHAGRADLAGVHHRRVREERGAARDEVLEVRRHLRLEQAAQDLEVLARALADARALELADRRVDLLDERDLDGAQGGVAAVGGGAARRRRARRSGASRASLPRGAARRGCRSRSWPCRRACRRHAARARPPYRQSGRPG